MGITKREYSNGEVTIVWKPDICSHCGICYQGLPAVFKPRQRPWIEASGASSDEIIAQVCKCPTGALSFYINSNK